VNKTVLSPRYIVVLIFHQGATLTIKQRPIKTFDHSPFTIGYDFTPLHCVQFRKLRIRLFRSFRRFAHSASVCWFREPLSALLRSFLLIGA